jgi:alkylation response protein AidB-like acyl-CoA dehydrogenase
VDLRPSDEQQQLADAFGALYGKESSPERVRAAEPLGFDERLWHQLLDLGALSMAVDEDHGGWGATALDLELVAEEHGRALGSAPLFESQVAGRLLARVGGEVAGDLLARALAGERLVTVSPRTVRDGVVPLVPAGAVATDVIVRHGDALVVVPTGDDRTVPENVGSQPLADVPAGHDLLDAAPVLAPDGAGELLDSALDDWLLLTAGALAGMAERAVQIGVAYASEREAFGQKIGAFQAVGHRLADGATASAGATLLAREAAWAVDEDPGRSAQLAAMAFAFAAQTARDTTDVSLHVHGGYGFMLEYDIQLYYRRARGWANVLMSPAAACRRVADKRYGPVGAR